MKAFEFRELSDNDEFDPQSISSDTSFTQAHFFGSWQEGLKRKVRRFVVLRADAVVAYFQVVTFPFWQGRSYLYIPYGPVTNDSSEDFLSALKKHLVALAHEERAIFVRLDFTPHIHSKVLSQFFTRAPLYTYQSAYFQPRAEWFLDVQKPTEDILKEMHQKTRYSIRLADKKEVTAEITQDFEKYFDAFYSLMDGTAQRNGFGLHTKEYYKNIFESLSKVNLGYLAVAKYKEEVLAIDLVIVYGGVANYVYGGSSSKERNRMPTYAAQWKAIVHAKELGCTQYNFGGIATENNAYKGWEGLTIFKKKFGGTTVQHSDFFDVVVNPFWYYMYTLRKRLKSIVS